MTLTNTSNMIDTIKNLNLSSINNSSNLPDSLLIGSDKALKIYYAPFDYVNENAKVVIVGITPGFTQLKNAFTSIQNSLKAGYSNSEALKKVKSEASFSGSMRTNLIEMLDFVGLNKRLGISSTSLLFTSHSELLHSTSVLKYPVFINGENYNGTPSMLKNELLRNQLIEHFAVEAQTLKDAIFIPLGPKPTEALEYLASKGLLDRAKILSGFLHPSAASQERINYFLGKKPKHLLSAKTNAELIDKLKESILEKMNHLFV